MYFPVEIKINHTRLHFLNIRLSSFGYPVPTAASALCPWLTKLQPNEYSFCQIKLVCLFSVVFSYQQGVFIKKPATQFFTILH